MPAPDDDLSRRVARLERRRPWSIAAPAIVALAVSTILLWNRAHRVTRVEERVDKVVVHHYTLPKQHLTLTYGSDGEGRELGFVAPPPPPPPPLPAPSPRPQVTDEAAAATVPAQAPPTSDDFVPFLPTTSSITGVVTFTGQRPTPRSLNRSADAFCGRTRGFDESVIVNENDTLRNVVIRLVNGPRTTPPSTRALVEQRDCSYRPRVQGVVAGQTVDLRNTDQTLHNVHTYRGATTLFCQAQLAGSPSILKTFNEPDRVIKLKCDVHPWMTGYLVVNRNPWFAVTDDAGRFTIANAPPGRWTLEAWHERYGTKQLDVLVTDDQVTAATFAYTGAEP